MLEKYGHWLKALATGLLKPETEEQARFVLVTKRKEEPRSAFEWAWVKAFPTFQRKPWDGRLLSALDEETTAGESGQPRRFDSYEKNTGESWSDRTADWQDYSEQKAVIEHLFTSLILFAKESKGNGEADLLKPFKSVV